MERLIRSLSTGILGLALCVLATSNVFAQLTTTKSSIAFGNVIGLTSKADSFYVKNTTQFGFSLTGISKNTTSYAVEGNPTALILPNDSVKIKVTFTPAALGSIPDTVRITHNSSSQQAFRIPLSGTGTNPLRITNPRTGAVLTSLAFTDVLSGSPRLDSVTIKNDGSAAVTVSAVDFSHASFTTLLATPATIAGKDSVKVMLQFLNTTATRDRATMSVVHNSSLTGSSPLTLSLTGRSHGHLRFSLAAVNLDNEDSVRVNALNAGANKGSLNPLVGIDSSKVGLITIRNLTVGAPAVRVDSITFNGPHFRSITPTPYTHAATVSADRILQFIYQPKTLAAVHRDTISVWTNDTIPGGNRVMMLIEGGSTRRVTLRNGANALTNDFGTVGLGNTAKGILRIYNFQDVALTIDSLRFDENDGKYQITSGTTNLPVAAGDTLFVDIQFTANDTLPNLASTHPDTILVYSAFHGATPGRFPVLGRVASAVQYSAAAVNFGNLRIGATKDSTIKLYNRTANAYQLSSLALVSGTNFTIQSNTLVTQLPAGDSVSIELRFNPTIAGLLRDTLLINHTYTALETSPRKIALLGTGTNQTIIDPANYITVDNVRGLNGFPTQSNDSSYAETGPFWENLSTLDFGGTTTGHRRSPNLDGSPNGSSARWTFTVDKTAPYLIYHYILNSANVGTGYYVHLRKFGVGGIVDSIRYSMQQNNVVGVNGTWFPIMFHNIDGVGPNAASITIGADAQSGAFMRVDAIRLLRSSQSADLEFGRRTVDFAPVRVLEDFGQITLGDELVKNYRLFNLGSDTLVISDIRLFATATPVPWFYTKNLTLPLNIPPLAVNQDGTESGGWTDIELAFSPFQEGSARDSLVIYSNDSNEPQAYIPLIGEGVNYNFIMNASAGGAEPHFRAPGPPAVQTIARYREVAGTAFLNSVRSPIAYPVPNGNISSRVNVGGTATLPHQAIYEFELPEIVLGKISTEGRYILEYGGPAGSPNGYRNTLTRVVHTFGVPQDSGYFSATTLSTHTWLQIGGTAKTFFLTPGGPISITLERNAQTELDPTASGSFLRADLLRVRKVPSGALIGVNVIQGTTIGFGDISYRTPAGLDGKANKKEVLVGSRGESQVVISSLKFRDGRFFKLVSPPATPIFLRALTGELKLTTEFVPDRIFNGYIDTLEIRSNSTRDSIMLIPVAGNGIGGIYAIEDDGSDQEVSFTPARGGLYLSGWDKTRMTNWQVETNNTDNIIGRGKTRHLAPLYFNGNARVEWFPQIPTDPAFPDSVLMNVAVTIPRGGARFSPAARYKVYSTGGIVTRDTVVSQNSAPVPGQSNVIEINLGNHWFLRGGRDVAGGQAFFGHVRLENDTAEVSKTYPAGTTNFARRDTFALLADAIILRELDRTQPTVTDVEDGNVPLTFSLSQNYPNPFNPTTNINFSLPERLPVDLRVYDLLGREVVVLLNGEDRNPGRHTVRWDGRNSFGQSVSTGVYFYRIVAGGYVQSKKMVLLK
ncbi:MAG: choice-of-anchor D domain-containing protein [Ignavibacteriales bacterium]|nr:choice-of-anchor D domain-containing protein [Ignavibacteriales bacterium]